MGLITYQFLFHISNKKTFLKTAHLQKMLNKVMLTSSDSGILYVGINNVAQGQVNQTSDIAIDDKNAPHCLIRKPKKES